MPEKSSTVATYAISASLAALVLGYVFGPSIFPDNGNPIGGVSSKRVAVGLSNPANDCFINSVLQALAGLQSLRVYLAQIALLSEEISERESGVVPVRRALHSLVDRSISIALKSKLDELNNDSRSKKTISASDFIKALETAFQASISRRQQDAHEFLQLVAERLDGEFKAYKKRTEELPVDNDDLDVIETTTAVKTTASEHHYQPDEKQGVTIPTLPLEGILESQIECLTCQYKPKANSSSFVTLTLNVPQKSSTTLDECLDGLFKAELIDGFKCDRCQVEHALRAKENQLNTPNSSSEGLSELRSQLDTLRQALEDHSKLEHTTKLVHDESRPKQRIAKSVRISSYPQALALHLSRSIFSANSMSTKNAAKVEFAETLMLGFADPKRYRLSCVVTHRGGHNSGHYETFRRQYDETDLAPAKDLSLENPAAAADEVSSPEADLTKVKAEKRRRKTLAKMYSKWWCISDAKVRECNTAEVLRMQKEVYLLFYEAQSKSFPTEV